MSIFLDANVLLEVLLPERAKSEIAYTYLQKDSVVSPLSAHLYVHFGKKEGFHLETLTSNLKQLRYTSFGAEEIWWAITNCQSNDFEDALQVACAVLNGAEEFVTLDKPLTVRYRKFIKVHVL